MHGTRDRADLMLPTVNDYIRICKRYDKHCVFELKNAVDLVAGELGISTNTVYFHLRNVAKK